MKLTWAKIKDVVWALSLIGVVITWRVDKARDRAIIDTTISQVVEDVSEIKSTQNVKFQKYDQYWIQNTKNITRIVTVLELPAD